MEYSTIPVINNIRYFNPLLRGIEQQQFGASPYCLTIEFWSIYESDLIEGRVSLDSDYTICIWLPKGYKKREPVSEREKMNILVTNALYVHRIKQMEVYE